jgi:hypothetical protein
MFQVSVPTLHRNRREFQAEGKKSRRKGSSSLGRLRLYCTGR